MRRLRCLPLLLLSILAGACGAPQAAQPPIASPAAPAPTLAAPRPIAELPLNELLVQAGHVPQAYVDKMLEREQLSSTYLGAGLAMPHGTNDSKPLIQSTGMSVLVVPEELRHRHA